MGIQFTGQTKKGYPIYLYILLYKTQFTGQTKIHQGIHFGGCTIMQL